MVTPDYQEFANRANPEYRDNTVICGAQASARCRNRASVARLPRCQTSTKAELCRRNRLRRQSLTPIRAFSRGLRGFRRRLFRALVDHLVDDPEVAGHV